MSPQQQLLQDEARAWRRVAESLAAHDQPTENCGPFLCTEASILNFDGLDRTYARVGPHVRDMQPTMGDLSCSSAYDGSADMTAEEKRDARVLAALWLALEAEDELKALTPKKRPAGPSSLRRPRQHRRGK